MRDQQHPTQAVTPGADPVQSGEEPDSAMVDPAKAAKAEFSPVLDESGEVDTSQDPAD